jgi:hypothetical protein
MVASAPPPRAAEPVPSSAEVAAKAAEERQAAARVTVTRDAPGDRTAVAAAAAPLRQRTVRAEPAAPSREAVITPETGTVAGLADVVAGCYELAGDPPERMELAADGRGSGFAGAWWGVAGDTIEVAWARGGSARFVIRAAGDTLESAEALAARVTCGRR